MLLAIDIGNTLIDFGFFDGEELRAVYKVATKPLRSEDEYRSSLLLAFETLGIRKECIEDSIVSCVVPPLSATFSSLCLSLFGKRPFLLGPGLSSGVRLEVDNPSEVGGDLVADAAGAKERFGGDLFIADLGTASKYILISKDASFGGLSIAPGLRLSIDALTEGASALPEITLLPPKKAIGKNTADCMNAGILFGTVYEVRGFAEAFERESGRSLKKILTGGNAKYVSSLLPEFAYEPHLLLWGLEQIYRRNRRKH